MELQKKKTGSSGEGLGRQVFPSKHCSAAIIRPRRVGVEVFAKSCSDIKNCGTRAAMKSQLELCAKNLSSITEADEEEEPDDEDSESDEDLVVPQVSPGPENGSIRKVLKKPGQGKAMESNLKTVKFKEPPPPLPKVGKQSESDLIRFGQSGLCVSLKPSVTSLVLEPADVDPNNNTLDLGDFAGDVEVLVRSQSRLTLFNISHSDLRTPHITRSSLTPTTSTTDEFGLTRSGPSASLQAISLYDISHLQTTGTQTVDERDTMCQVGSSLERLWKELSSTDSMIQSSSLNDLDLAQGMETVREGMETFREGLCTTYEAAMSIFNGYMYPTNGVDPETEIRATAEPEPEVKSEGEDGIDPEQAPSPYFDESDDESDPDVKGHTSAYFNECARALELLARVDSVSQIDALLLYGAEE